MFPMPFLAPVFHNEGRDAALTVRGKLKNVKAQGQTRLKSSEAWLMRTLPSFMLLKVCIVLHFGLVVTCVMNSHQKIFAWEMQAFQV
jgi:hypothetical protein